MSAAATTMPDARHGRSFNWWLRLVTLGIGTATVAKLLGSVETVHVAALVKRAGWPVLLVLLPTALAMGVDAQGWQLVLRALGNDLRWSPLLRIRFAVESVVLAVPAGPVAGEALKAGLLRQRAKVPLTTGAASLALSKAFLWGGESDYLLLAPAARAASAPLAIPGLLSPLPLTLGGAVIVATLSLGAFAVLRNATWASRLGDRLARAPWARVRRWTEDRRSTLETLDRAAGPFYATPWSFRARCLLTFTTEWLIEGLETLLILRCIGVVIGAPQAIALDGVTSLMRAAAFFVPAGLGVQDVTQLVLLRQLGVPDANAAAVALIFIKRSKEVFWVFTGSLFIAGTRRT